MTEFVSDDDLMKKNEDLYFLEINNNPETKKKYEDELKGYINNTTISHAENWILFPKTICDITNQKTYDKIFTGYLLANNSQTTHEIYKHELVNFKKNMSNFYIEIKLEKCESVNDDSMSCKREIRQGAECSENKCHPQGIVNYNIRDCRIPNRGNWFEDLKNPDSTFLAFKTSKYHDPKELGINKTIRDHILEDIKYYRHLKFLEEQKKEIEKKSEEIEKGINNFTLENTDPLFVIINDFEVMLNKFKTKIEELKVKIEELKFDRDFLNKKNKKHLKKV